MAVNVVVSVLVARHLGPEDMGVLSFGMALTAVFAVMAGLGLENVLLRDLAEERHPGAWRAALQLRYGVAALAYVLTVVTALVWRSDSPRNAVVTAIVAVGLFFGPADLIDVWFQARGRVRRATVARQFAVWIAAGWRFLLVLAKAPLIAFALASVAETAAVAFALVLAYRGQRIPTDPIANLATERLRLLREGWPLLLSGLLVTITMQADRLLLGYFRGDKAVGIYAVAVRLTELFHMLPLALGAAITPHLARLRISNEPRYWSMARKSLAGLAAVGLILSMVIALFGPRVIPAIFGPSYASASLVLVVHAWTLSFVFIVSVRSRILVIETATHSILWMALLTALFNVAANIILIPKHGGEGAAWAAVIAWSFSALIAPWIFTASREVIYKFFRF